MDMVKRRAVQSEDEVDASGASPDPNICKGYSTILYGSLMRLLADA